MEERERREERVGGRDVCFVLCSSEKINVEKFNNLLNNERRTRSDGVIHD